MLSRVRVIWFGAVNVTTIARRWLMAVSRASFRSDSTFRMLALPATEARTFRKNPAVIAESVDDHDADEQQLDERESGVGAGP